MTTKKALKELKKVRAINGDKKENKYIFNSFVKISNESLDKAIEALEKIEKIEEIKKEYQGCYPEDFWYLIREVIEENKE